MSTSATERDGSAMRGWLNSRIVSARADPAAAERRGRTGQDDCDMAAAEETVCTLLNGDDAVNGQRTFAAALKVKADRNEYAEPRWVSLSRLAQSRP